MHPTQERRKQNTRHSTPGHSGQAKDKETTWKLTVACPSWERSSGL